MITAKVKITIEEAEDCKKCRFFIKGSTNFGRTSSVKCLVSGFGDNSCDNSGEEIWSIENMRKDCPFVKALRFLE